MFKSLRRRWALSLVALLAVLGGAFAVASPAAAVPATCTPSGSWHTAGSPAWGQVRWCWLYDTNDDVLGATFQVQDILTDGWNVHVEIGSGGWGGPFTWSPPGDNWAGRPSGGSVCQSSGSVTTCLRPYSYFGSTYTPGSCFCFQNVVRVVKGSANGSHPAYGMTFAWFNG